MTEGALNVLLGLVASFVAWYVLWHMLSPKVELSPYLGKLSNSGQPGSHTYRIKLRNARRRPCFEASFDARMRFRSLDPDSDNFDFINLRLSASSVFLLERNRILRIYTTNLSDDSRAYLERFDIDNLDLEQLLLRLPESRLTISCITTDGFSGSRKCFLRHYTIADVREGKYQREPSPLKTWYQTTVRRHPHPSLVISQLTSATVREDPDAQRQLRESDSDASTSEPSPP
jgi:hypothetical protein